MSVLNFIFSDGERVAVAARSGETILQAARRHALALSSDCEIGDCQTCRATIQAGAVTYDPLATTSLTAAEMAEGEVLTCIAAASGDLAVRLPYERSRLMPARSFRIRIEALKRLGTSVMRVQAQSLGLKPLAFLPGQYINVTVPDAGVARSYSMASAPSGGRSLDLLVRLLDDGAMSTYLRARAAPGDQLECEGPYGTFHLREGDGPVLMVAGGTGLAPMLAMLRQLAERRTSQAITLCFGVTTAADLFSLDDLAALGEALPGLALRVAVAQGEPGSGRVSGLVTNLLRPEDAKAHRIYLCGPPAMTDAARSSLAANGADTTAILQERFLPTGQTASPALSPA